MIDGGAIPPQFFLFLYTFRKMTTPNWQHNSGKNKNPRGISKGKIKSRKQVLQHIKSKYGVK
jgi:hypothetical protein